MTPPIPVNVAVYMSPFIRLLKNAPACAEASVGRQMQVELREIPFAGAPDNFKFQVGNSAIHIPQSKIATGKRSRWAFFSNLLQLQIDIVQLMPWKPVDVQLFHEGIRVKFFNIKDAGLFPFTGHEQQRPNHRRNSRGITHALCAGFLIGILVFAIVIDIICFLLVILLPFDPAADGSLA